MDVEGLIIEAPRKVSRQRLDVPDPANDDALIRVEYCGLCTPEQRVYRGAKPSYPYWGGHELSGIVEALPGSDTCLNKGQRVAVLLMVRCGTCDACLRGLDNHCAYLHPAPGDDLPVGPRGLVNRIAVPQYKAFPLPDTVPKRAAALIEPVACALRSVKRAAAHGGDIAAVVGGGTMGLIHVALLVMKGCRVFVFDDDESTHEAALSAGAQGTAPLSALVDRAVWQSNTDGWGYDVIACTRFGAEAVNMATSAAARGSRILLYQSITGSDELSLSANEMHYREISLIGSVAQSASDVDDAVQVMASDAGRFEFLRIETMSASQPTDAFEAALRPELNRVLVDLQPPFGL